METNRLPTAYDFIRNDLGDVQNSDRVVFYEIAHYEGPEAGFDVGEYPFSGKAKKNEFLSVRIPTGIQVKIFSEPDFEGKFIVAKESIKDLREVGLGNDTKNFSFKIYDPRIGFNNLENKCNYKQEKVSNAGANTVETDGGQPITIDLWANRKYIILVLAVILYYLAMKDKIFSGKSHFMKASSIGLIVAIVYMGWNYWNTRSFYV